MLKNVDCCCGGEIWSWPLSHEMPLNASQIFVAALQMLSSVMMAEAVRGALECIYQPNFAMRGGIERA